MPTEEEADEIGPPPELPPPRAPGFWVSLGQWLGIMGATGFAAWFVLCISMSVLTLYAWCAFLRSQCCTAQSHRPAAEMMSAVSTPHRQSCGALGKTASLLNSKSALKSCPGLWCTLTLSDLAAFDRHPEARGAPIFLIALPGVFGVLLGVLVVGCLLAKWVLMGRYREGRHPLWSFGYLRWWLVRCLKLMFWAECVWHV